LTSSITVILLFPITDISEMRTRMNLPMNRRPVAASRQSAANPRNNFQRRSAEAPLRDDGSGKASISFLALSRSVHARILKLPKKEFGRAAEL
jgi:hypothetical protein